MELSDLRVFRAVAREGGVTRAAQHLHRVPSNVTVRVRKLEQDVGAALFLREGKRMTLSPAGRVLLDYAERLLGLAEEARAALHDSEPQGTLRLGAMESTAAARLPAPLGVFHARHPKVVVELHVGDPRALAAKVLDGDLDAALVAEPVTEPRLASLPTFLEELVFVARPGHRRIAAPADADPRVLLAFHHECPYRQRLEEWFARGQVRPERVIELGSYHAILGCALVGMGVALMPRSVLDTYTERARLSIHRQRAIAPTRTLLVWRTAAPQAKVAALAAVLREAAHAPGLRDAMREQRATSGTGATKPRSDAPHASPKLARRRG